MKNPRVRLLIPGPIAERLQWECSFLRVDGRLLRRQEEERLPRNRNEIIRRAVELFVAQSDELGAAAYGVAMDGPTTAIPFFFAKNVVGAWDYALGNHWAVSYHELAAAALAWRFRRQDEQAAADLLVLRQIGDLTPSDLAQMLRSHPRPGDFRDALEASRHFV